MLRRFVCIMLLVMFGTVPVLAQEASTNQTIADILQSDERLSTLWRAIDAQELGAALATEGPFTLLAPTNDAFGALIVDSALSLDELLSEPGLSSILLDHIVSERVTQDAIRADAPVSFDTLGGSSVSFRLTERGIAVNDVAVVTETGIPAANGVIHIIDTVLLPDQITDTEAIQGVLQLPTDPDIMAQVPVIETTDSAASLNLYETLERDGRFSLLLTALNDAGLSDMLTDENSSITLFAPTDTAINRLANTFNMTADELLHSRGFHRLLPYHIVSESVTGADLAAADALPTLHGAPISVSRAVDERRLNGTGTILVADIAARNGTIYIIDTVLLPPD